MTDKTKKLEAQIVRLKNIAIDLKVNVNIRDDKIRELEHRLTEAHSRERNLMAGTQTISKLEILGNSDDDNGQDPRDTGRFKSPWEGIR